MNNEDKQQIDNLSGGVVSIVPTGWKLWSLVFRAVAEGHLSELEQHVSASRDSITDSDIMGVSLSDAFSGLYIETCEDTRRELPIEIYSVGSARVALSGLKRVAKEILKWYEKARPYLDEKGDVAAISALIADNCRVVIQLLGYKPDKEQPYFNPKYDLMRHFGHQDMVPWHGIINGVCIEKLDYDEFSHILNCYDFDDWYAYEYEDYQPKDYSKLKIKPSLGYGMAVYAFLLLLLSKRYRKKKTYYKLEDDEEDITYVSQADGITDWADEFRDRIDWNGNYNVREDSWKTGYFSSDDRPSSYPSGAKGDEMDRLRSLCGRYVFDQVVGYEALDAMIGGGIQSDPGFEQYKYLHDHDGDLSDLYGLLVRERDYLYDNLEDIIGCFYDEGRAELQKNDYSKYRFETKKKIDAEIEKLYTSQFIAEDIETLHHVFFARCEFAYEYLWQQPLVHSGMVRQYLQNCIVQNELLLTVIKRGLGDNSVRKAFDEEGSEVKVSKLEKRIEKAIAVLRGEGIIDENNNIKKQSDRIELVRILIRYRGNGKEYARPSKGWGDSIKKLKDSLKKHPFWYDEEKKESVRLLDGNGRFTRSFYSVIYIEKEYFFASRLLRDIDWKAYNDKFYLDGKSLQGEDLRTFIASRRDLYVDIIKEIIEKYEKMDFCSTVRIMKV